MFNQELKKFKDSFIEIGDDPRKRAKAFQAALEWAVDRLSRLNRRLDELIGKFRQRKARWGFEVKSDEIPNKIERQVSRSRMYFLFGIAALIAEAAILFWISFDQFGRGTMAAAAAVVLSVLLTLVAAWLVKAAIVTWCVRNSTGPDSEQKIWRLLLPSSVLTIVCLAGWFALQRMPADTIIGARPILVLVLMLGLIAFVFFGSAWLVLSKLLAWSKRDTEEYEALLSERQELMTFRRECAEDLGTLAASTNDLSAGSVNGQPEASKIVAVLLIVITFMMSACTSDPVFVHATEDVGPAVQVEIDASGIRNRAALEVAANKLNAALPSIIAEQGSSTLRIYWFGATGWSPELKAEIELPPVMRVKPVERSNDEVSLFRPDVAGREREILDQALKAEQIRVQQTRFESIRERLGDLSGVLLPPPSRQSRCTDLVGNRDRHQVFAETNRAVLILVTDGEQNCRGVKDIGELELGRAMKLPIVVIIVPPTENEGYEHFVRRKKMFEAAYGKCVEVVRFDEQIDMAVRRSIERCRLIREEN